MSAVLEQAEEQLEFDTFWRTGLDGFGTSIAEDRPSLSPDRSNEVMDEFYIALGLYDSAELLPPEVETERERRTRMEFNVKYGSSRIPFRGDHRAFCRLRYSPAEGNSHSNDRVMLYMEFSHKDHDFCGYADFLASEFQSEYC